MGIAKCKNGEVAATAVQLVKHKANYHTFEGLNPAPAGPGRKMH